MNEKQRQDREPSNSRLSGVITGPRVLGYDSHLLDTLYLSPACVGRASSATSGITASSPLCPTRSMRNFSFRESRAKDSRIMTAMLIWVSVRFKDEQPYPFLTGFERSREASVVLIPVH